MIYTRPMDWKETVAVMQRSVSSGSRGETGLLAYRRGANKARRGQTRLPLTQSEAAQQQEQHPRASGVAMETQGRKVHCTENSDSLLFQEDSRAFISRPTVMYIRPTGTRTQPGTKFYFFFCNG